MPAGNLADGQVTHMDRTEVDTELADEQWDGYVAALDGERLGDRRGWPRRPRWPTPSSSRIPWSCSATPPSSTSPAPRAAVAETAAAEADRARPRARASSASSCPGTLDGGDVLKVGTTVYVGRGGRTNAEGIRQLRAIVSPLGYTVVAVPVTKVLHLKTAVTALPDGTVIGYPPLVDDPAIFDRFLAVPEPRAPPSSCSTTTRC